MIADLLAPNLNVVICGTALGSASAEMKQYYAGPGNKFWWVLHETRLTPRVLKPAEYAMLLKHGIGLTDILKNQSGADADLTFEATGSVELDRKVAKFAPRVVCFNGKRAAKEYLQLNVVHYGRQDRTIGKTVLYVAPSTSGAARRWWDPNPWFDMARLALRR